MKKVFFFLAGLVVSMASFAQFSLGIQATGSASHAQVQLQTASDATKKMKLLPGAGLVAQYKFSETVGIRTGINYLQNGVTVNTSGIDPENVDLGTIKIEASTNLHYLQAPLNVLYYIPAGNAQFYVGAGAFINYGIAGKTKFSGTYTLPNGQTQTVTDKQDAFKKESDGGAGFKKFDWGATAFAGVQFSNHLFVQAGYQYSISDIDANKESAYKNRSAQISIGYFFLQ